MNVAQIRPIFEIGHRFHRLMVAVIVAAFVVCGIHGFKMTRSRYTEGYGILSSSDRFLLEALGVDEGAEKITTAISDLPPLQPLAIIAPNDNVYASLLLPTIGSFTWPRGIYLIHANNLNLKKTLDTLRRDQFAAVLYYDLAPPIPNAACRRVGLLTIAPLTE